jgi:hypothetical protein
MGVKGDDDDELMPAPSKSVIAAMVSEYFSPFSRPCIVHV